MITDNAVALFRRTVDSYPDATVAKILADELDDIGLSKTARLVRSSGIFHYHESGYGGGDGGYGGDGGGGGGGGYGGDGDGGYGGVLKIKNRYSEGIIVGNGFYILTVAGGYAPYVLVGWVERHDDMTRLRNSRVIRKFGSRAQLSVIAKKGPRSDTDLLDLSPEEWIPVGSCGRIIPADPKAWKDQCPKPEEMM